MSRAVVQVYRSGATSTRVSLPEASHHARRRTHYYEREYPGTVAKVDAVARAEADRKAGQPNECRCNACAENRAADAHYDRVTDLLAASGDER